MTPLSTDLHYLDITELATLIRTRQISPVAVTRAQLDRIAAVDGALDSYALVTADLALAQAEAAEAEIAAGRYRGVLHGVPIAVKDLCWTKGIPTAAGMPIHQGHCPTEDATVVQRLKEAGAVLLGKLQLTEGAYSDHHPLITPPKNAWNADYWPGISSSGPGAATAAGLCYGSLASDTGGSIRWPAAANGVTGLKPGWGRVSRHGVFELAASMDHVGPMARSAADAAMLLAIIAGGDPKDPTAIPGPAPDYAAAIKQGIQGVRIGVDAEWNSADVDPGNQEVLSEAIEIFRSLGAHIVDVAFPDATQAVADWAPACAVEAACAHQATYPARKNEYGAVLASVIETGGTLSGIDYQKLILRRLNFSGRVATFFSTVDLLLTPVHPFAPLSLDAIQTLGEQPHLILNLQRYTCPFNLTGNPTITLPGGFSEQGLPIGFQLVAGHLDESMLIRAGAAFQSTTPWHRRHPVI
ncbi:amidase [Marinobacter sp. 71-i]|uniref:Amidase n=1 Tax=Marinobacter iranensis TaxID=2962607 RepID=A0ABT5YB80_9GAMM|nr:amidase [Marinobacter iranensis]MDF0750933.1 amidase [Marinobacter iranensis]